jgi:hypothetical protein
MNDSRNVLLMGDLNTVLCMDEVNSCILGSRNFIIFLYFIHLCKKKVKLSRYTPWRHMRGEKVQLLLILNIGTRWG